MKGSLLPLSEAHMRGLSPVSVWFPIPSHLETFAVLAGNVLMGLLSGGCPICEPPRHSCHGAERPLGGILPFAFSRRNGPCFVLSVCDPCSYEFRVPRTGVAQPASIRQFENGSSISVCSGAELRSSGAFLEILRTSADAQRSRVEILRWRFPINFRTDSTRAASSISDEMRNRARWSACSGRNISALLPHWNRIALDKFRDGLRRDANGPAYVNAGQPSTE